MLITVTYSVDDVKPSGEAAAPLPLPGVGGDLGGQRGVLRVQPRLGGGVAQGLQRLLELTHFTPQFISGKQISPIPRYGCFLKIY